jgi:hypothetical protein
MMNNNIEYPLNGMLLGTLISIILLDQRMFIFFVLSTLIHCLLKKFRKVKPNMNIMNDEERTFNQLISLPPLPGSLQELHCEDNCLTNLPPLPEGLQELY